MLKQTLKTMIDNLCRGRLGLLAEPHGESVSPTSPSVHAGIYPAHNHPYAEMVQAVDRPALLNLDKQQITLTSDQTYLILPETLHAEHYFRPRSAYALLWVVFAPQSVSMFINHYSPLKHTNDMPQRLVTPCHACPAIWRLTSQPDLSDSPLKRAKLQSLLIQFALEIIEKKTSPKPNDYRRHMIDQVIAYIDHHYRRRITVNEIAQMVRCTPNYLNTVFGHLTGQSIHRYVMDKKLSVARDLLRDGDLQIKQIAYEVGFTDPLYFSRAFRKQFGKPPSQFLPPSRKPRDRP